LARAPFLLGGPLFGLLLARPELLEYWRRGGARVDTAGEPLFEEIPALFNRLVAFDARVPHAVRTVEGPRDPREGRVAIQGWLCADGCVVEGPLDREQATAAVRGAIAKLPRRALGGATGLLSVKLEVAAAGHVKRATTLVDVLVATGGDAGAPARAATALTQRLKKLRLPPARSPRAVVVPVSVADGEAGVDTTAPCPCGTRA
jgi:hypothetical protein